jgi:hypothetical protein
MATGTEVLSMLCPTTEWVITGNDFDAIQWIKGEQITKTQFEEGFAQYDAWKAEQDAAVVAAKEAATAKLVALGLTTDDLKALGLGTN